MEEQYLVAEQSLALTLMVDRWLAEKKTKRGGSPPSVRMRASDAEMHGHEQAA